MSSSTTNIYHIFSSLSSPGHHIPIRQHPLWHRGLLSVADQMLLGQFLWCIYTKTYIRTALQLWTTQLLHIFSKNTNSPIHRGFQGWNASAIYSSNGNDKLWNFAHVWRPCRRTYSPNMMIWEVETLAWQPKHCLCCDVITNMVVCAFLVVRLSHGGEAITNSIALTTDDTHMLLTIVHYIDKYRTPTNTHNPPV